MAMFGEEAAALLREAKRAHPTGVPFFNVRFPASLPQMLSPLGSGGAAHPAFRRQEERVSRIVAETTALYDVVRTTLRSVRSACAAVVVNDKSRNFGVGAAGKIRRPRPTAAWRPACSSTTRPSSATSAACSPTCVCLPMRGGRRGGGSPCCRAGWTA